MPRFVQKDCKSARIRFCIVHGHISPLECIIQFRKFLYFRKVNVFYGKLKVCADKIKHCFIVRKTRTDNKGTLAFYVWRISRCLDCRNLFFKLVRIRRNERALYKHIIQIMNARMQKPVTFQHFGKFRRIEPGCFFSNRFFQCFCKFYSVHTVYYRSFLKKKTV